MGLQVEVKWYYCRQVDSLNSGHPAAEARLMVWPAFTVFNVS